MLVTALRELALDLRCCFLQARVFERFLWFLMALFSLRGRRTLSAALPPGSEHSAYYRLFSRDLWSLPLMFEKILQMALPYAGPKPYIAVSLDDTYVPKTGRLRGLVRWIRDAVRSTYRTRLCPGLRWVHAAIQVSIPGEGALALTVGFELAQPLRKPKRGASKEAWREYRKEAVQHSTPTRGASMTRTIRIALDRAGCQARALLVVVDAGYMNRSFLADMPGNTGFLGRVRRDVRLVHPPTGGRRRLYGDRAPTPEQLRQDDSQPWIRSQCYFGGDMREIRYKELGPVRWQHVTRGQDLRLLVVAPTPYWLPGRRRKGYNQPAYLLTSDLTTPAEILLQSYFERWQIEVVHRDLKAELGLGQPQVWAKRAVQRVIPSMAAFYALLRLAALKAFGPGRNPAIYGEYPSYRRGKTPSRPSARDLLNLLRQELRSLVPGLTAESA